MNNSIELQEPEFLVASKQFKWAHWPFENFNVVQSSLYSIVSEDCNCLVAASTSAGKTVISEMFGSYEIRNNKKKFLFLVPLRALANEKYNDWTETSHHFSDLRIGIFTGDYKKDNKESTFDDFDVIIMTSEMLNHKLRTSAKNRQWIEDIGVMVVDESHLLTVEGRGDHLEAALINFTKINNNARLVFLSATLPNVTEISEWMCNSLNNKKTYILKSKYRPCVLKTHSMTFDDQSGIRASVYELIDECFNIIKKYNSDKFLVFVHAKKIGEMFLEEAKRQGIVAEFHNANLDKKQRHDLEVKFKTDKNFRVLVATSTLAWGVNLPARRVIVAGVTRGNDVLPWYDALQMVGRAGRPAYDPQGDAYVMFPESRRLDFEPIVLKPQNITSRMYDVSSIGEYNVLAFHLVYEVFANNIKNKNDFILWSEKTLASYQKRKINDAILDKTIQKLLAISVIRENAETKEYEITGLGKVSALFYANPFDVANWASNFSKLFKNEQIYDLDISLALASTSSNIVGNLSKEDKVVMEKFLEGVKKRTTRQYPDNVLKIAYLYYKIINGRYETRHVSIYKTLQNDFPRVVEILKGIDNLSRNWGQKNFFNVLQKRVEHGVPAKLVGLIEIKGIGKVKAEKLFAKGFKNKTDIANNLENASKLCGIKVETLKSNLGI